MKRYLAVAVLALVGLALVLVGPGPIKKGEAGPASPTVLLCYWAQATSGPTADVVETLTDQWGSTVTDVRTPQSFCNPADKTLDQGSAAGDFVTATHLTCFSILEPDASESFQPRFVEESDQFGQLTLHIDEPTRLCVPSDKNVTLATTTQTSPSLVPFECYRVDSFLGGFTRTALLVADQYTSPSDIQVRTLRPVLFCNSVEKGVGAGIGAALNGGTHMTCYRITRFAFALRTEYVTNQFGAYNMNIIQPQMLCVSADKIVTD